VHLKHGGGNYVDRITPLSPHVLCRYEVFFTSHVNMIQFRYLKLNGHYTVLVSRY